MTWQRIFTLLIAAALIAGAWRAGGWAGLALAGSAVVLWFLLYYTRVLNVMKRAANRPIGYVGSAVMLNAKLKPRKNLLHVMAMTQSMGERLSPETAQPQIYRWSDPGGSQVTAEFVRGKLTGWRLDRPAPPVDAVVNGPADEKISSEAGQLGALAGASTAGPGGPKIAG